MGEAGRVKLTAAAVGECFFALSSCEAVFVGERDVCRYSEQHTRVITSHEFQNSDA